MTRETIQSILDFVATWGPWLATALLILSTAGMVRAWRRGAGTRTRDQLWQMARSAWLHLAVFSGICLFLLKVQMAPMTQSLAALRAKHGKPVPSLAFRYVGDDTPHDLAEFRGKVVVVNLWATWCPPCVQELATLGRLQREYADRGLVVLALADQPREELLRFFKQHPSTVPSGYADSFDWLQPGGFRPFTLFIDRQGMLRQHVFGVMDYAGWERYIRPYL